MEKAIGLAGISCPNGSKEDSPGLVEKKSESPAGTWTMSRRGAGCLQKKKKKTHRSFVGASLRWAKRRACAWGGSKKENTLWVNWTRGVGQ